LLVVMIDHSSPVLINQLFRGSLHFVILFALLNLFELI